MKMPKYPTKLILLLLFFLVAGTCVRIPSTSALADARSAPAVAATAASGIIMSNATLLRRFSHRVGGEVHSFVIRRDGNNGTQQDATGTLGAGPIIGIIAIVVAIVLAVGQTWYVRRDKRKPQDCETGRDPEEDEAVVEPLGARREDYELRRWGSVTDTGFFMGDAREMPAEHPERPAKGSTARDTHSTHPGGILYPACPEPAVLRRRPVEYNSSKGDAVTVLLSSSGAQMSFLLEEKRGKATPAPEVDVVENAADEGEELGLRDLSSDHEASVKSPETLSRSYALASDSPGERGGEMPAPSEEAMQDPLGAVDMDRVVCRPARKTDGGNASRKDKNSPYPAAGVPLIEGLARTCGAVTMVDTGKTPATSA